MKPQSELGQSIDDLLGDIARLQNELQAEPFFSDPMLEPSLNFRELKREYENNLVKAAELDIIIPSILLDWHSAEIGLTSLYDSKGIEAFTSWITEDIVKGNTFKDAKRGSEIKSVLNNEQYAKVIHYAGNYSEDRLFYYSKVYMKAREVNNIYLKPAAIDFVAQSVLKHKHNLPEYQGIEGLFLSALIQNSYAAGNNNFVITCDKPIKHIAYLLRGTKEKPITITLKGPMFDEVATWAHYVRVHIEGNAKYSLGNWSENSIFVVDGDVGNTTGKDSKNGVYIIKGNAGDDLGFCSTNENLFVVYGNAGRKVGHCQNSTFILFNDIESIHNKPNTYIATKKSTQDKIDSAKRDIDWLLGSDAVG